MPPRPGSAYNWLCVLSSAADIASNAARYRAAQVSLRPNQASSPRKRRRTDDGPRELEIIVKHESTAETAGEKSGDALSSPSNTNSAHDAQSQNGLLLPKIVEEEQVEAIPVIPSEIYSPAEPSYPSRNLQSSKVPSSRFGRLFHYGGLAASLGYGAASEFVRRSGTSKEGDSQTSLVMNEANIKRLVSKLSQMRGAALKLGQFLSIQDTHILPPDVDKIFRRVQDSAHYMPDWQMKKVMTSSLGPEWSSLFTSFDRVPFASASIGQVHSAVLNASISPTKEPLLVAVKVQFPNIGDSISSDLSYINWLLTAGRLLPKGLFLDRTMKVMKEELKDECDYAREASFARRFREALSADEGRFYVPWVWEGSTKEVLVMEMVEGLSLGELHSTSQEDRNKISERIIELCMKELFHLRMMQTDPNWSNFLWDKRIHRINLIDFGASREYSKEFMDGWFQLLKAAADDDRDACISWSRTVGYLTGQESETMLNAHVTSLSLLATPFKHSTPQPFHFGSAAWHQNTAKIRSLIPVMLQERLTPPPRETYSLNRKLSGAFLLASRLGGAVDVRRIWDAIVGDYGRQKP